MSQLELARQHFQGVKEREFRLPIHFKVTSVSFSCDGRKLAVCSSDGILRLWDNLNGAEGRQLLSVVEDPKSPVSRHFKAVFHPLVPNIVALIEKTLIVFDIDSKVKIFEAKPSAAQLLNVAWCQDGTRLAVGTRAEEIFSYEMTLDTFKHQWTVQCPFEANQFIFSADGCLIVAGSPGSVHFISPTGSILADSIRCSTASAYSISARSDVLAVGASDATVTLFHKREAHQLIANNCMARLDGAVKHVSFSYDGMFVAAGGDDKFIDIGLSVNGDLVHRVPLTGPLSCLSWHPNSLLLCFAADQYDKNGRSEFVFKVFGFAP